MSVLATTPVLALLVCDLLVFLGALRPARGSGAGR
jgi:hypothetical protein